MLKAEVEKWLEYACDAMPSTIRTECKQFVDQYEPIIATLIAGQINPDKVCQFIGVCPKSADSKVVTPVESKDLVSFIYNFFPLYILFHFNNLKGRHTVCFMRICNENIGFIYRSKLFTGNHFFSL